VNLGSLIALGIHGTRIELETPIILMLMEIHNMTLKMGKLGGKLINGDIQTGGTLMMQD
jgi:hypothetical protein